MKIRPLQDRVLVKRFEDVEQTKGGLFVPTSSQKRSQQGVVAAVGPGRVTESGTLIEPVVRLGDHVCLANHSGQEVEVDGKQFTLVRESDILYVVDHPEDQA